MVHNLDARTSPKHHLKFYEIKGNGCIANIYLCIHISMQVELQEQQVRAHSNVYIHWGHATTWICNVVEYSSSVVMCCGSGVFILMFQNVRLWLSMCFIFKMNTNNQPKVCPMIHDNRPLSPLIFQNAIPIHVDIFINLDTDYRIWPLNLYMKLCYTYHHLSHVTSHCSHVIDDYSLTAHRSCLSFPWLCGVEGLLYRIS